MKWLAALAVLLALSGCEQQAGLTPAQMQQQVEARRDMLAREKKVVEQAPWFGKTGLGAATERELQRYVRHALGQVIFDPGAVKAADLAYLGAFREGGRTVRYWRIPPGEKDVPYAFVETDHDGGVLMGVGFRAPPAPKN